jgi:hypothetical protein
MKCLFHSPGGLFKAVRLNNQVCIVFLTTIFGYLAEADHTCPLFAEDSSCDADGVSFKLRAF